MRCRSGKRRSVLEDAALAMGMARDSGTPPFLPRIASAAFTRYQLDAIGPRDRVEMMTIREDRPGARIGATPPDDTTGDT